ncbi:MAG: hypothetical protein KA314_23380 [Chloroflexi bacterium]|nr:hypothetical protein [Chloroflexota bacterium]MBP8058786.1 hypothetical protein [Chloroflexota bacterium]
MSWYYLNLFLQVDPNLYNNFLLLGYAVMWIIGVVYIISLYNRQRNLRQDIHTLRQLLDEDEEK